MPRHRLALQRALLDAHPELASVGSGVWIFPHRGPSAGRRAHEAWLNSMDGPRDALPQSIHRMSDRRAVIRAALDRMGFAEDGDFVCGA